MKRCKVVRNNDDTKIHVTTLFLLIILILREVTNVSVSQISFIQNALLSNKSQIFFNESRAAMSSLRRICYPSQ